MRKDILKLIDLGIDRNINIIPSSIVEMLKAAESSFIISKDTLKPHSNNTLVDFNYSVKIAIGSDTSSIVKVPVVQLELFIKDVNGMIERVVLELNKHELRGFIDQLVQIEKVDFM